MKKFEIYENPQTGKREAVKVGWSWPGFFFTGIWLLVKRMWPMFVFLVAVYAVFAFIGVVAVDNHSADLYRANAILRMLFGIAFTIYIAIAGNRLFAERLMKKGYTKVVEIDAPNKDSALMMYQQQYQPNNTAPNNGGEVAAANNPAP